MSANERQKMSHSTCFLMTYFIGVVSQQVTSGHASLMDTHQMPIQEAPHRVEKVNMENDRLLEAYRSPGHLFDRMQAATQLKESRALSDSLL